MKRSRYTPARVALRNTVWIASGRSPGSRVDLDELPSHFLIQRMLNGSTVAVDSSEKILS